MLPLISHFRINGVKLSFFLSVFHNLVSFHGVSAVIELQEELEEFAVAVLGILRLGKRVDHVTSDFPDRRIVVVRRITGGCLFLLTLLFNYLCLLEELWWGSVHRAHASPHHHVVHHPRL